jgi:hypothetical protein
MVWTREIAIKLLRIFPNIRILRLINPIYAILEGFDTGLFGPIHGHFNA